MAQIGFSSNGGDEIVHDLDRFRVNLTQAKPAFEKMSDLVAKNQRDQFDSEGRHYGNGWSALSPEYAARKSKARPNATILEYNGDLRRAAAPSSGKGFSFYKVTDKGMEVGVDKRDVPYAQYHQEGTENLPVRIVVGQPTKEDQKAMTKIMHTHIIGGTNHARS